jgi:hypothetical protein
MTSSNMEVVTAETNIVAGSCLTSITESGRGKVKRSTGTSADIFAGFSLVSQVKDGKAVKIETLTIPASGPYTLTLAKTPSADADISVRTAGGTAYTQGVAANGVYSVSGAVLTFHSSNASVSVIVTYKYNITVTEAAMLWGDQAGVGSPTDVTNTVSISHSGYIYTDQFDSGADWNAASITDLKTGANGLVVRGGSGVAIKGSIVEVPTADTPFLGLFFAV